MVILKDPESLLLLMLCGVFPQKALGTLVGYTEPWTPLSTGYRNENAAA